MRHNIPKQTILMFKKKVWIPGPLVKAPKVTQDQYDMEKDNKVSSSVEG